ncbi:hypothetical protein D044_2341B, partial [Vibrio parahaemolyticus EKP-026]
SLAYQPLPL